MISGEVVQRLQVERIDASVLRSIRESRSDVVVIEVPHECLDQIGQLQLYGASPVVLEARDRSLVVRLNTYLSDTHFFGEHREAHIVTDEIVEAFARVSGDFNPVHFRDEAAHSAGFKKRIAHGAILNALISRGLGQTLPGEGTIYVSQTSAYLKPVHVGDQIELHLLVKHLEPESGRVTVSTRVYGADGKLAYCGQAVVINRDYTRTASCRGQ